MVKGKNKIVKNVIAEVEVMHSPYPFSAVVHFYQDFSQAGYSEVKETMSKLG
jgi:predicted phosphoribosyltransferase